MIRNIYLKFEVDTLKSKEVIIFLNLLPHEHIVNKSHRLAGATLHFLLFLKANKEMFEQILTFPFL
jgi:hypothetical protein